MRKMLLTAAFAALTLASSVSANWITSEPTILAVNSGEAAFHTALTSDQRLDVNLTAGAEGKADLTFTTKASESALSLTDLPVLVSEEAGGAHIVSYKGAAFKSAFSAAELQDVTGTSYFTVEKKQLLLHVNENGTEDTYTLSLDTKSITFTAVK